jgi:hypothetical protein
MRARVPDRRVHLPQGHHSDTQAIMAIPNGADLANMNIPMLISILVSG